MATTYRVCVMIFACLFVSANAYTRELFSATYTGAELLGLPGVSFPTREPSLEGNSLAFPEGSSDFEKLLSLPILPEGSISGFGQIDISIEANVTRLSSTFNDFDPSFAIGDGTNLVAFLVADNNGGLGAATSYNDLGSTVEEVPVSILFTDAGINAVDESLDVHANFTFTPSSSTVRGGFFEESGEAAVPKTLNFEHAWEFVLIAENPTERYQINSISIVTVPEPSGVIIAVIGLLAFVPIFRTSVRKQAI